jgi:hypothetical protein
VSSRAISFETSPDRIKLSDPLGSPPEEAWFTALDGPPACDTSNPASVPACACHKQCEDLFAPSCSPNPYWVQSNCVAACEAASDAQRHALVACTSVARCDPTCFHTVGWDVSKVPSDNGDGGMGLGDAGF